MNFSEQPPSTQWAALKYQGARRAEVWFKPDGDPLALTFRVPRESFLAPGVGQLLTAENLLRAVGLAPDEVESWRHEGAAPAVPGATSPEETRAGLGLPLPLPASDAHHLSLHVRLKPPSAAAPEEGGEAEVPESTWQEFEARWNAIRALEASIDGMRLSVEALRAELETTSRKPLTAEEKAHALQADIGQWNKAVGRIVFVVPKAREFAHRAAWAAATPERKRLEEVFKTHIRPRVPGPRLDELAEKLDALLKDRQVLSAQGVAVCQECKGIAAEAQGSLKALQNNAAARKRSAAQKKGKSF